MNKTLTITIAISLIILSNIGQAHFQLLYTPESALNQAQSTEIALVFSHPFHNGYPMSMGTPLEFYVIQDRGESIPTKTTDLREYLQPVTWTNSDNQQAASFVAKLPRAITRSIGDYSFVLVPEPYYEEPEDKYIQQYTRTMINIGGVPGSWDKPLGLPVEIVPLDKPYANWVGGVFRGVVIANGKPVPNAEIEIEYLNHEPLIDQAMFDPNGKIEAPQGSFGTMSIRANDRGEVTIGLPKAGWWGICALDLDDGETYNGKDLSVDAVLWVRAYAP
ncbi:MAG: DUF4198 domain-containing protein [Proteobacteria bacterium]|jgi:cobalt/nickel transport protein|nr:DUF4198 domain-containing protein [Pseudomonadota bacterium]